MDIGLVVVEYNRLDSLSRMLKSLSKAYYDHQLLLYICLEHKENTRCQVIAKEFQWNFSQKEIIIQSKRQGLKNHIFQC